MWCSLVARRFSRGASLGGLVGLLLCFAAGRGGAQSVSTYAHEWFTVDGGGQTLSFGVGPTLYRVSGTAGQPDAGELTGGAYRVLGGFWGGAHRAITAVDSPLPEGARFRVLNPRPNPAPGRVTLAVDLPSEREVTISIYDVSGRRVRTLSLGRLGPGRHSTVWDGTDPSGTRVATGIYFIRTQAGKSAAQGRLVLLDP